jgi:hypothetical protein
MKIINKKTPKLIKPDKPPQGQPSQVSQESTLGLKMGLLAAYIGLTMAIPILWIGAIGYGIWNWFRDPIIK